MALEEQIVKWSETRPAWQRDVLRRVATGVALSGADYDQLIDDMLSGQQPDDVTFGLAELPQVAAEDPPVRLLSIAEPEHVNALASDQPLTFEACGLTIVYGDNGSGKSGYARLLKRITRARWARERAGYSVDALAGRFPRLDAWERGEVHPTPKQLESFAKATFTPVGFKKMATFNELGHSLGVCA
jgi:hypothetical protein